MPETHSQLEQRSENVWLYRPMAVMRTNGAVQVYSGARLNELIRSDEQAQILFYDIFRSPDGKTVVALQAPEFENEFGEWNAYCRGERIERHRISSLPRGTIRQRLKLKYGRARSRKYVVVWILKIPAACRAEGPLKLEIAALNKRISVEIPASPFRNWDKVALTQQCMQKDYPLVWIRDHCLFYHRAHGYRRIVLYDNDSSDFDQLLQELSGLDKGLQILVVPWPFRIHRSRIHGMKMGVLERQFHDTISKKAAFNHGFRMLGHLSGHMTNLDLDEYLFNRTGIPLADYMARKTKLFPYWLVDSERYEYVAEPQIEYPVRAVHFRYQSHDLRKKYRDGPIKYFYRSGGARWQLRTTWLSLHYANYQGEILRQMLRAVLRQIAEKVLRVELSPSRWPWKWVAPPSDIVMYHYNGIRTDWDHLLHDNKKGEPSMRREELTPGLFEVNDEMPELLRRIGLAD